MLAVWLWWHTQSSTFCWWQMTHKVISPLRCDPAVETNQEAPHDTVLGMQYYFQTFPDFIELNSAELLFKVSLRKNISNEYQIRNRPPWWTKPGGTSLHWFRHPVLFSDFSWFYSAQLCWNSCLRCLRFHWEKTYQINIKSGTAWICPKLSGSQFPIGLHLPDFFQHFWHFSCTRSLNSCYDSF